MKKVTVFFIICIFFVGLGCNADAVWVNPVNSIGEVQVGEDIFVNVMPNLTGIDGERIKVLQNRYMREDSLLSELEEEVQEKILANMGENEFAAVIKIIPQYEEEPYPEFEKTNISVGMNGDEIYGGRTAFTGVDFRVFYIDDNELTEVEFVPYNTEAYGGSFDIDKWGYYILYYNPYIYYVNYYKGTYDEGDTYYGEKIGTEENLTANTVVSYPEIPKMDGFVFTGWKSMELLGGYDAHQYVKEGATAFDVNWNVYASWCEESEYTPLEINIESGKIVKGKEDGQEIILTLSEGKFAENIERNIASDWTIAGSDEIIIGSVERIDDTTVKLILAGESSKKYTNGEIWVEFNSDLYESDKYEEGMLLEEIGDVQLNEDGVKRERFISDNSITLEKQKRRGGTGGEVSYSVKFNSNGGNEIEGQILGRREKAVKPENPEREGFVFKGWYEDSELTNLWDFEEEVDGDMTLYASWEKEATDRISLIKVLLQMMIDVKERISK